MSTDERVELAPLPRNAKILAASAVLVAAVGLAIVTLGGLGDNLIFYWTPTEMKAAGDKAYGATIRLGGQVVPGTIQTEPSRNPAELCRERRDDPYNVDAEDAPRCSARRSAWSR